MKDKILSAFQKVSEKTNFKFAKPKIALVDLDPTINIQMDVENEVIEFNESCLTIPTFKNMVDRCGLDKFLEYSILTEILKHELKDPKKAQIEILKNYLEYHEIIGVATGFSKKQMKLAYQRAKRI